MKTVVLISAIAEWNAVKEMFPQLKVENSAYGESARLQLAGYDLKLYHSGWGKIASAGMMQYVTDHDQPDLVVNLGTCGGFEGLVERGDVVLVERTFIYDIVELMGDLNIIEYYASTLDLSWLPKPYPHPVRPGMIASADSDLPPEKIASLKTHGAIVGDWESGALAWVAAKNKQKLLILRGVSDLVSEQVGEAYDNLALFEERTKDVMRELFRQLPDWLKASDGHL
jgi:adenosylhomocysteine nucleosidase